jgi:non-ribosomal peptide synthetase component E (peptide arylation enzyme)
LTGGEALSPELQERFFRRLPTRLLHYYGPTEAAIACAGCELRPDSGRDFVPLGRPTANTQLYILDRHLHPVPVGVPGELYIGGIGLARGYLEGQGTRRSLTAERFIPDPFSGVPGARLYNTGDVTRYRPDGAIEFFGRRDHQVKVRGFRIELGEVEAVLGQHPGVRASVVVGDDSRGDRRLVAYVVPPPGRAPARDDLRDWLKERLPDYMVPAAFVLLEALPLTPNGKIDRLALPRPDAATVLPAATYVAPRTPTEAAVAAIWAVVLGVALVGVEDDFFALGGHSLLAVQIFSRVRAAFAVEIPLLTLFETPTVAALARALDAGLAALPAAVGPLAVAEFEEGVV